MQKGRRGQRLGKYLKLREPLSIPVCHPFSASSASFRPSFSFFPQSFSLIGNGEPQEGEKSSSKTAETKGSGGNSACYEQPRCFGPRYHRQPTQVYRAGQRSKNGRESRKRKKSLSRSSVILSRNTTTKSGPWT